MSKQIAIKAEGLSKAYPPDQEVLGNVSFEVYQGETLGIIGKNGAGKSTLLKILAGAVKPTSGRAELHGTIASILEIGMGFHPELNGLDNIYLAGGLLGFSKKEVAEKVEEIIDFSELRDHINKQVKNYSSGMFLRLAFSVFALLDTDILLLDEVLSVGDASFRNKSFNMMSEFKRKGKTIVLVSHNFKEIEDYCDRVIYLDKEVKLDTISAREAIMAYFRDYPIGHKVIDPEWDTRKEKRLTASISEGEDMFFDKVENDMFKLVSLKVTNDGQAKNTFLHEDEIKVHINYIKKDSHTKMMFAWNIFDMYDSLLFSDSELFRKGYEYEQRPAGQYETVMVIPGSLFNSGQYFLTLVVWDMESTQKHNWYGLVGFEIQQNEWMKGHPWSGIPTPLLPKWQWITEDVG